MADKILVVGSSGLVGSRFVDLFDHPELLVTPSEDEFNLLSPESIKKYLSSHPVGAIVNFGAFTDVGAAEKQRDDESGLCWRLNVAGVKNVVSAIGTSPTHFIQISTDMVFSGYSGNPGPYAEDHPPESDPAKISWYGYTKALGELAAGTHSTIVRISYPVRAKYPPKLDYFRKPLSLYDQDKLYPLFTDQRVTVTFIDEVVPALQVIISHRRLGVYHVSSSDTTTPYQVVSYLLQAARRVRGVIRPASLSSQPNPVRYPQFGGLKCAFTAAALGLKFSSTRSIVDQLVSQGLTV